jgi:hypothetical protein
MIEHPCAIESSGLGELDPVDQFGPKELMLRGV